MASAVLLHIGTPAGLFVASKPGTSPDWRLTKHSLEGRRVVALALGAEIPVRVVASVAGVGLFHTATGGREWMLALPHAVSALAQDPQRPERLYAAAPEAPDAGGDGGPGALGSDDAGLTWRALGALPARNAVARALALTGGAGEDARLWAGLETGGILYSADGGARWQGLNRGLDMEAPVTALAAAGAADLFAAGPAGMHALTVGRRADDVEWKGGRLFWRALGPDAPKDARALLALGRAGGGAPTLLAADAAGALWRGDEGGAAWTAATWPAASGAPVVTALVGHPDYPDRAYAGTRDGRVFETRNRGGAWTDIGVAVGHEALSLGLVVIK
jgi:hypothetical protein